MTLPTVVTPSEPLRLSPATRRAESVWLIPAATLLILWIVWIPLSGGYGSDVWYPSALGAGSVALAVIFGGRRWLPPSRTGRLALLAFVGLVALNYLSMLWSGSPGSALDASDKLLLYAAIAWVFAILPWTPRLLAAALGVWAVGVFVFCAIGLLRATSGLSLAPFFVEGRYATPLQYPNATAALAVMGMWAALILSARRELPFWLRAPLLAVAVFLADFALLPQSRGALLGLVLSAPVALVASSDRFRLVCRMAVVGGGIIICVSRTVAVDDAVSAGRHVAPLLDNAAQAMFYTSLGALLIGTMFALVENRWSWHPAWLSSLARSSADRSRGAPRRQLGRTGKLGLAAVLIIALGGVGIVAEPAAVHAVNTVLKQGRQDASTGSTRLLSGTPEERLDYARVSLHLFSSAPILGVGAGNFGRRYDGLRRFEKHSQYTHDVALRVLSETGITGMILLIVVVGAIAVGLLGTARRVGGLGRACAVGALTIAAFFLVHDSLDWLDQFPALAAPALALPMAAMTLQRRSASATSLGEVPGPGTSARGGLDFRRLGTPRIKRIAAAAGVVVAALAICLAVGGPYLSIRLTDRAFATYGTRPAGALHDLKLAETLNPLSVGPITSQGTIALYLGEPARAQAAFERAIQQEDDWYPRLELALLDAQGGDFAAASIELRAAAALDADDPVLVQARTEVARHRRIEPARFNQLLVGGTQADVFAPSSIK